MTDREKVIKGLTELKKYLPSTMWESINDALSLLKEQEQQIKQLEYDLAVTQNSLNYYVNGND